MNIETTQLWENGEVLFAQEDNVTNTERSNLKALALKFQPDMGGNQKYGGIRMTWFRICNTTLKSWERYWSHIYKMAVKWDSFKAYFDKSGWFVTPLWMKGIAYVRELSQSLMFLNAHPLTCCWQITCHLWIWRDDTCIWQPFKSILAFLKGVSQSPK